MKKILAFLVSFLTLNATVIINNPNGLIKVYLSKSSVNRIVLPEKILDLAYSKEKGLIVKVVGNQAFLKYKVIKEQKFEQVGGKVNPNSLKPIGNPQIKYLAKPSEVYFITKNKTYSFLFIPKNIKPQTIIINDFGAKVKEIIKYETEDSYIKTLAKITKTILNNQVPFGYKIKTYNKIVYKDKIFTTVLKNEYDGVIYKAYLFEIHNKSAKPYKLNPRILYNLADKPPVSLTIFYDNQVNYLLPFSKAYIVIIEKRN